MILRMLLECRRGVTMAKGFKGNPKQFDAIVQTLKAVSKIPATMAREAARGIAKAIDEEFEAGCDPYGTPWTPLADSTMARGFATGRTTMILTLTYAMRASIIVEPMPGAGIRISIGEDYARYHQSGTAIMPARPILPKRGMPDQWARALSDAGEVAFKKSKVSM